MLLLVDLDDSSEATRVALRAFLVVLEVSPIRFGLGARTMSGLSRGDRTRYLAVLDERGASELIVWKTLVGAAYFAHPIGAKELRHDQPPPSPRARVPASRRSSSRGRHRALPILVDDARGAR